MAGSFGMTPVSRAGARSEGLLDSGDRVVWYGWKFGLPHVHESRVATFDPPHTFCDAMERGRFKRFEQEFNFSEVAGHTLVLGYVRYSMYLGPVGRMAGRRVVLPHMVKLLRARLALLKQVAESEQWRQYLPE
ncbi:MAG: hypothetical protein JST61_06550 [Acidobacteria bacterium]|nr:hypothetical protein [Acidobacteriota bacterium]